MLIDFFQRLSFKLTRASFLVVIALGLAFALLDLYSGYASQKKTLDHDIQNLIKVSQSAIQKSIYSLDHELARDMAKGLISYDIIKEVSISDEDGLLMAHEFKTTSPSSLRAVTARFIDLERTLAIDIGHRDIIGTGRLMLVIDNHAAFLPFYSRSAVSLAKGIIQSIVFAFILILIYHLYLTRPLFQLTSRIAAIDNEDSKENTIRALKGHTNDELGYVVESFNSLLNHRESQKADLKQREEQLRLVLDSSPNLVLAINSNCDFILMNKATSDFYGGHSQDMLGKNLIEIQDRLNETDAEQLLAAIVNTRKYGESPQQIEQALTNSLGQICVLQMSLKPFQLNNEESILIVASDISDRVAAEEAIEKLAYYDALTQLPNRNQLQEILFSDLQKAIANDSHGALLFIDIDDFKRVNDTLGHSVGDELLLSLSSTMSALLEPQQTLARLGGDEFILSLPNISHNESEAEDYSCAIARKILEAIKEPVEFGGHLFSIGASIGIVIYPDISQDTDRLLQYADTAMYKAKANGRNTYCVFEAAMAEEASKQVSIESQIQKGIENNEFTFFLQPIVDAQSQTMVAAEALIRWRHPHKGLVMPGDFIPFLEQSAKINQVGSIILDQVCGFIKACSDNDLIEPSFKVSVNVSANEIFQSEYAGLVETCLNKHGISGKHLEMEITESVALKAFSNVTAAMSSLKALGVTFALDDFGTGFSSLNYLKRLPVDKIKIDKSFIDEVPRNSQDTAVVNSVINIANNLHLGIVVEGVEHEEQALWFQANHNLTIQGYYFDRPMPSSEFVQKYLKI